MAKRLARGGRRDEVPSRSILTRAVDSVFDFVRLAEFEILFVFFFVVAYVIFKDLEIQPQIAIFSFKVGPKSRSGKAIVKNATSKLAFALRDIPKASVGILKTSRPEYNEMLVKKPDWWPY